MLELKDFEAAADRLKNVIHNIPLSTSCTFSAMTGAEVYLKYENQQKTVGRAIVQKNVVGFVIEHNPKRMPGGGSCIFAHVWKAPDEATAGCTAMDEKGLRHVLAWLRPERRPVFVLLPEAEAERLHDAWGLP